MKKETIIAFLTTTVCILIASPVFGQQTLAEKLGYAADARLLDENGFFYPTTE